MKSEVTLFLRNRFPIKKKNIHEVQIVIRMTSELNNFIMRLKSTFSVSVPYSNQRLV